MTWTFWGMILLFLAWLAHGALLDARNREKKDAGEKRWEDE